MMLIFLLGDVLCRFAGHMTPGEIDGQETTQADWLGAAALRGICERRDIHVLRWPRPSSISLRCTTKERAGVPGSTVSFRPEWT